MQQPKSGLGRLIFEVSNAHRIRHTHTGARTHTGYDPSALAIISSQRPLPTQRNKQEMNIHALSRIRTRDPINRAAPNVGLRPRGHRDQLLTHYALVTVPLDAIQPEILRAPSNKFVWLRGAVLQQTTNISKDPAPLIFRENNLEMETVIYSDT